MKVLITGGTGFLGQHLVSALAARGDETIVLSRDVARAGRRLGARVNPARAQPAGGAGPSPVRVAGWDHQRAETALAELAGAEAVVHLAGAPAVGQRWTREVKRRIVASRIDSTRALVAALAQTSPRPRTLVCASGVGYYGARDDGEELDEDSPPGTDFLATVCRDWESAAEEATAHRVRVVRARCGIVLGPGGGALEQLVKPFQVFAGGPLGTGRQLVSWIHLEDAVRALLAALDDDCLTGPVNLTTPHPVTNAELMRSIGDVLGRPAWIPIPAAALRLRLGEGADPLLTGQRAVPRRLRACGFEWRFPDVRSALLDLLG